VCARARVRALTLSFPNNFFTTVTNIGIKFLTLQKYTKKILIVPAVLFDFQLEATWKTHFTFFLSHTLTLSLAHSSKPASLSKHFESLDATEREH
jgi:hypothetical protein